MSFVTLELVNSSLHKYLLSIYIKVEHTVNIILSCITCSMTWVMYLPVSGLIGHRVLHAMNKADKIFLVTEFAFLRQESDDKQVKKLDDFAVERK